MAIPPGAAVLVVEDEWIIGEAIARMLRRAGCRVLGPAGTVADALAIIGQEAPAAALLDASLGAEPSFAVADLLAARGIPFAFLSGRRPEELPPAYAACRLLTKPFREKDLAPVLKALLDGGKANEAAGGRSC
jgi:DNA-binding response OmpR family regulator